MNGQDETVEIFMPSHAKIAVRHDNYWYTNKVYVYAGIFGKNDIIADTEEQTLYIYNQGSIALNIYDVSLTGDESMNFSIISYPTTPIASGDSAALKIKFDPSQIGNRIAVISIVSNDTQANTFMFTVDGSGESVPIIDIHRNNTHFSLPSGVKTDSESYFGIVDTANQYIDKTFIINNKSSSDLENCSLGFASVSENFTILKQPDSTIKPGDSTSFTIRFDPLETGTIWKNLYFNGNFRIKSPSLAYITLSGVGYEPTITKFPKLVFKGNGIDIKNINNTPITNDNTFFGIADISSGYIDKTFTIKNSGDTTLSQTMMPVVQTVNHKDKLYFSFLSQPATQIAPGDSSNFTIRFQPTQIGIHNARIVFSYNTGLNDYFLVQGLASNGSEIFVESNSLEITDGDTSPDMNNNTDFGSVEIINGANEKTYTIKNTGTHDLNVSTPILSGSNSSDFTLITTPSTIISPDDSTTFTVRFTPQRTDKRTAEISITNSDADEEIFNFTIQGTGILKNSPEIVVEGNSIEIISESTSLSSSNNTIFGNATAATPQIIKSFTIKNTGNSSLYLSNLYLQNNISESFSIVSQPDLIIAANSQTPIDVSYAPTTSGTHQATVLIPSNDQDEGSYTFLIEGKNNSGYTLTLNIFDTTGFLPNASVVFEGSIYTTDANGQLEIISVPDGTYNYTVSKTGYSTKNLSTTISSSDKNESVTMQALNFVVSYFDWDHTYLMQTTTQYNHAANSPTDPTRIGYTFTGWDVDFNNVTSNLTVTAQYTPVPTDIEGVKENATINIYPNPVKDILYITIENDLFSTDNAILIFNTTGKIIRRINIVERSNSIDVSDLTGGVYFVKIGNTTKKNNSRKLIFYI